MCLSVKKQYALRRIQRVVQLHYSVIGVELGAKFKKYNFG